MKATIFYTVIPPEYEKKMEHMVFQATDCKTLTGSDEVVDGLIVELLAIHRIG